MEIKIVSIYIERETLLMLNGLLNENPLLKQDGNNYGDLINVLISKYRENQEQQ